jgi:predicted RNA-binding Zn-ribbon protein involved in translation (DUF1610 family)
MTPRVRKTCPECGSKEIRWDALVRWDEKAQDYEISSVDESLHICNDCGSEFDPDEHDLEDDEDC